MKQTEQWAKQYLQYRGFSDLVHEPDGQTTPDFLIDGRIAVEVRRLNQYRESEAGGLEALEKLAEPREKWLTALLESLGPPVNGLCWYVFCTFKRPQLTENWRRVARQRLQLFQSAADPGSEGVITIDDNFRLELARCHKPEPLAFIMEEIDDEDAGGWVIPELRKSLAFCIEEKSGIIAPVRKKYPEWWLLLIDYMLCGRPEPVYVKHDWDKVLVVHPGNYASAYEVKTVI